MHARIVRCRTTKDCWKYSADQTESELPSSDTSRKRWLSKTLNSMLSSKESNMARKKIRFCSLSLFWPSLEKVEEVKVQSYLSL